MPHIPPAPPAGQRRGSTDVKNQTKETGVRRKVKCVLLADSLLRTVFAGDGGH